MAYQPKSYKKFVATAATATLVASAIVPVASANGATVAFNDVSDRYKDAVDYLVQENLSSGLTETSFGVQSTIKRGDAALILASALGIKDDENAAPSGFSDVPTRAALAINSLKAAGIINGKTTTRFGFEDNLTRGEVALLLANAKAYNLKGDASKLKFTDVSSRYAEAVAGMVEAEITAGKTATSFGTSQAITRGEFAIFIYKAEGSPALKANVDTLAINEEGNEFTLNFDRMIPATADVKWLADNYAILIDGEAATEAQLEALKLEVKSLSADGKTLVVSHTDLDELGFEGESVELSIGGVKDTYTFEVVTTPAVESVTALNLKQVEVKFNMNVDADSAENPANYTFAAGSGLSVTAVTVEGDTAWLTINNAGSNADQQQSADLTINGVKAENGTVIAKTTKSVKFLDTTAPTVTTVGTTGPRTVSVKFSEPMEAAPSFSLDNGTIAIVQTSHVAGSDTVTLTLGTAPSEGVHTLNIKNGADYAGFKVEETNVEFTYAKDTTAPVGTVKSASPNKVVLEFDEALTNVANENVQFFHTYKGVEAYKATKSLSTDGKELTLTFANPLPAGPFNVFLDYTNNDGTQITDAWGNKLAETTFSGAVTVDVVAPTITKVEADGNSAIKVTYSEDVDGASTLSNYTLKDAAGNVVTLTGTVTKSGNVYSIPTPTLNGGSYTLTVKNIKDVSLNANKMEETTVAVSVKDIVAPTVKDSNSNTGTVDAQLLSDTQVKIAFSEVMDNASITNKANYQFVVNGVTTELDADVTVTAVDGNKAVILDFSEVESGTQVDPKGDTINVLRVKDVAGNFIVSASTPVLVPGTVTAPLFDSAVATGKNTIKLYFDELLTSVKASDFVASVDGEAATVTAITNEVVDGASVLTLTVDEDIDVAVTNVSVSTADAGVTGKNAFGALVNLDSEDVLDGYAPIYTSAETRDTDGDSKIDRVIVNYAEGLYIPSVSDTDFTVEGYTITSVSASGSTVTLNLKEKTTSDLTATPKVTQVSAVEDLERNVRSSQDALTASAANVSGPDLETVAFNTTSGTVTGDLAEGYVLTTNPDGTTPSILTFDTLATDGVGTFTAPVTLAGVEGVTREALKAYNTANAGGAADYLNDAVDGLEPFAMLKSDGTTVSLLDGYQYSENNASTMGMVIPADYPEGTYTLSFPLIDAEGSVTFHTIELTVDHGVVTP